MNNQKTFLDLLAESHKDDSQFNIDSYLEKFMGDCNNMDKFDICQIIPGSILIAKYDNFNIVYHGKECSAESVRLYQYGDHYILYNFDGQGDDLEVLDILDQFGNGLKYTDDYIKVMHEFIDACIVVYHKDQFKYEYFLDHDIKDIDVLVQFFRNMDRVNGWSNLQKYVSQKYESYALSKRIIHVKFSDHFTWN